MLKNKNMSEKFITSFVVFIVIPFFVISIIVNMLYERVLFTHYNEKVQQIMEQLSTDIETELRRVSLDVAKVSNERELLHLISSWYDESDPVNKFETSIKIEERLDYLFAYQGEINSMVFFSKSGQEYIYGNPLYINESAVKSSLWYKECLKNKNKVFNINNFKTSEDGSNGHVAFLVGVSPSFSWYNTSTEFIYFEIKTEVFNSMYSRLKDDSVGEMLIVDSSGNIVISPNKSLLGKNTSKLDYINEIMHNNNNFYKRRLKSGIKYISKYNSERTGWTIINIIDYNALTKDTSHIIKTLLIIFIVFNMLFILYSKFFFRDIIKPIKELVNKMKGVEKGRLDEVININSNLEEIKELGNNYNKMISDIKKLMVERDLKERERSQEEIKTLQAQINPHFVYNTLNVIKLMAMISKAENIRNVTDSFMKLLSATFKSKSTFITVKEELEYLDNYTEIMKVRFGDDFNLAIRMDEEIKKLYVIKLILQPIVENAIIHGINEIEGNKSIVISGNVMDNRLILEVEDNGCGMSKEEIKNIFEGEENRRTSFNGIGIKNVEKRIKLNCGEEYGIEIHSEKNKYTNVKLILPVIKEEVD